ncbi:cell division protein FtsQ/DivIB [Bacteroidota bacterium]
MKRIAQILLLLFVAAYLVVVLGFVGKQYDGVLCKGMNIIIHDSLKQGLITAEDVKNLIRLDHPEIAGKSITALNASSMEESLNLFPAISSAEVYSTVEGKLVIAITQRTPVARIEDRNHQQYYLDALGYVIPVATEYVPHILHINGEIPIKYRKEKNIYSVKKKERDNGIMEDLLKMANYIQSDPFWNSQIVQVYVNHDREFELVPRVGSQIILFGDADQMENKFFKLRTLYREGFSHTGWNQYEAINLKYNNQVICTKR